MAAFGYAQEIDDGAVRPIPFPQLAVSAWVRHLHPVRSGYPIGRKPLPPHLHEPHTKPILARSVDCVGAG